MTHVLAWPPAVADAAVEETIEVQAIAWLKADARLTAILAGRIYTHVPPSTPFPLVRLEGMVPILANGFRRYRFLVEFQARASSQLKGPYEAHRIASRIRQVLVERAAPLPPFRWARWAANPTGSPITYTEEIAGVVTYHQPTIVRVEVEV
jgi:hypothetical protein